MKTNKATLNHNLHLTMVIIIVFVLAAISIFTLSRCCTTNYTADKTAPPVQENTNQALITSQPVGHNVDINPAPLTEDNKVLSLEGYGAKGALADNNLTIMDMLTYAVQDEYLARGEYLSIIDKFGSQRPYSNIIRAEETHLAYLKEVYLVYGLDFPNDASVDHIVVPADLLEAAKIGVQAEMDNIAMYELFLTYDLPENIVKVFTALQRGSESHLLAFQKQVDKLK